MISNKPSAVPNTWHMIRTCVDPKHPPSPIIVSCAERIVSCVDQRVELNPRCDRSHPEDIGWVASHGFRIMELWRGMLASACFDSRTYGAGRSISTIDSRKMKYTNPNPQSNEFHVSAFVVHFLGTRLTLYYYMITLLVLLGKSYTSTNIQHTNTTTSGTFRKFSLGLGSGSSPASHSRYI